MKILGADDLFVKVKKSICSLMKVQNSGCFKRVGLSLHLYLSVTLSGMDTHSTKESRKVFSVYHPMKYLTRNQKLSIRV